MRQTRGKRRVSWGRLILMFILIVAIIIAGWFAFNLIFNKTDPYKKYNEYDTVSKQIGDVKQNKEEGEDTYYYSIFYPETGHAALDSEIKAYCDKAAVEGKALTDGNILYVDYDSTNIYDHYISIAFHQSTYDKEGNQTSSKSTNYNYDTKLASMMDVHDVLRRDYMSMLKTKAKSVGLNESDITAENLSSFKLSNSQVSFMINDKELAIPYAENKEYIHLTDKNIPSLYQNDPIIPAEQPEVDPNKPMIAITYDDGPSAAYTQAIMDIYEKNNSRATFYMLGLQVEEFPEIAKDVYKRGFEIGNHSYDHSMAIAASASGLMSKQEVSNEIYDTQDLLFKACGSDANMFRPPYGALNDNVRDVSTLDFALWNVDTQDWQNKNADIIASNVMANAGDGAVVLLHDIYDFSYQASQKFVPQLIAQGYQLVTIDTLMKYKGDKLTSESVVIIAPNNQ